MKIMEIDGDEIAECDYGLIVDNSNDIETFLQKLEGMHKLLFRIK